MSSSEDRESFISIEDEEGLFVLTALKSGDIVIDITEWDRANPAEESSLTNARYVLSREDFFRLMDWMKGLV